jgi:hypothetical protein
MDKTKVWFDFMELANSILTKGQKANNYNSNIQVIYEPSFDNHVSLQLNWDDKVVKWYRTTWFKMTDTVKFNDPIESLKYIGKEIKPTLTYEKGETNIATIQNIVDFVKEISVKPNIDKWGGITLDGCYITLAIGVESNHVIYKWYNLPDEWKNLQTLADMIKQLNQKL